jgi:hypothetical protein
MVMGCMEKIKLDVIDIWFKVSYYSMQGTCDVCGTNNIELQQKNRGPSQERLQ